MTDTTTSPETGPVAATPLSFDQGIEAIGNLLSDDPETDLVGADEAPDSEVTSDEDEPDLSLDDDEDGQAADVEAKAPELSDDMEIMLEDGEKITLAQLKRNNLFQRDYSRKTEELAHQRKAMDQEFSERVSQASEDIRQQREFILDYAQRFLPQEPPMQMLQEDPVGYMHAKAQFDEQVRVLNGINQQRAAEIEQQQQQSQAKLQEFRDAEWSAFLESVPKLKDKGKLETFRGDVANIAIKEYKLEPDELKSIHDHRFLRVIHDAIAYRKLLAKQPKVQETVKAKPKLQTQQRMSVQDVKARDAEGRFQALKKNPTDLRAAERSIMDTLTDL